MNIWVNNVHSKLQSLFIDKDKSRLKRKLLSELWLNDYNW